MKNVNVMINVDEVFMNFYHRETNCVVPKDTKRVGSNRASDSKKGCTLMVSCEYFSLDILPQFMVMTGKHNKTLSRRPLVLKKAGVPRLHFRNLTGWMCEQLNFISILSLVCIQKM